MPNEEVSNVREGRSINVVVLANYGSIEVGKRRYDFVKVKTATDRVLFGIQLFREEKFFKQFMFEPEIKGKLIELIAKGRVELSELKNRPNGPRR